MGAFVPFDLKRVSGAVPDPTGQWFRSSFCADQYCLEVRRQDDFVLVRDGKRLDVPSLQFTTEDWNAFVGAVAQGEIQFDGLSSGAIR